MQGTPTPKGTSTERQFTFLISDCSVSLDIVSRNIALRDVFLRDSIPALSSDIDPKQNICHSYLFFFSSFFLYTEERRGKGANRVSIEKKIETKRKKKLHFKILFNQSLLKLARIQRSGFTDWADC